MCISFKLARLATRQFLSWRISQILKLNIFLTSFAVLEPLPVQIIRDTPSYCHIPERVLGTVGSFWRQLAYSYLQLVHIWSPHPKRGLYSLSISFLKFKTSSGLRCAMAVNRTKCVHELHSDSRMLRDKASWKQRYHLSIAERSLTCTCFVLKCKG